MIENINLKVHSWQYAKKVIKLLFWGIPIIIVTTTITFGQYPLLPIPRAFQSPSGEKGQILLDGIVKKVSLFHGKNDDEADWHVYISLDNHVKNTLTGFLKDKNYNITYKFDEIYSELMVLDQYRNLQFDEKFYSADVTKPFLLFKQGSAHPAWDFGVHATQNQGDNKNYMNNSKLVGGRAYLQGAFVNDKAHEQIKNFRPIIKLVEIHPLDGIAFAMDEDETAYSAKYGQQGWAKSYVRWRVAFFANSAFHRINGESYLKKDRVTTFYLDLPNDAYNSSSKGKVEIKVEKEQQQLWDGSRKNYYSGRGWKNFSQYSISVDPKDGRKKLKVTAIMKKPDKFGGIVVVDYIILASLNQQLD